MAPDELALEFESRMDLGNPDPDRFVQNWLAHIKYCDEDGGETVIGRITGFYVTIDLWSVFGDTESLFEVFDEHSQELSDLYEHVIGPDGRVRDDLVETPLGCNLLYIDNIYIEEEYRNQGIGGWSLAYFILTVGRGANIVVIKPGPIEKDSVGILHPGTGAQLGEKMKRLVSFYKRLGFRRLPGSPYMYFDTSRRLTLPDGRTT